MLCIIVTDFCVLLLLILVHCCYRFLCILLTIFCALVISVYRAAIVYSLIGTCRAAGVDPRTWMEDVLSKLPYWQRDGKDLAGLLPRAWAKENQITPK